jgi:alpha-methylacyl-CoA racemase
LLTAQRASALERLGLGWPSLHGRFPRLCHVSIVGHRAPMEEVPGHDLTYMALHGLLDPPHVPRMLAADLGAAERAAAAALGILLLRGKTGEARHVEVAIADAAEFLAWPLKYGLTADAGPLGGGLPTYGIYGAREGYIAVAAIEARFVERLQSALNLPRLNRDNLAGAFLERTAEEWESWAMVEGLPIAAVRPGGAKE